MRTFAFHHANAIQEIAEDTDENHAGSIDGPTSLPHCPRKARVARSAQKPYIRCKDGECNPGRMPRSHPIAQPADNRAQHYSRRLEAEKHHAGSKGAPSECALNMQRQGGFEGCEEEAVEHVGILGGEKAGVPK